MGAGAMVRVLLLAAVLAFGASLAEAAEGWQRLAEPGVHAIMRHALAPGTGDPADFDVDDCATQRNLDERGRRQARAIGAAIRAADVPVTQVLTSAWCRCRDTADLLDVGPVAVEPALNSFFRDRARGPAQTRALAARLSDVPDTETLVLVTHQVNVTALTGVFPRSGETVLFRLAPDGTVEVVERVAPPPAGD